MFSKGTPQSVLGLEQKTRIEAQIQALEGAYKNLREIDQKIFVPAIMGLFTWLRSNLGLVESAIMIGMGIYFLDVSFNERAKNAAIFKEELKKLAALYKSASTLGYRVTHDKVFLQALEALSPFIASTRDLLTDDFFEQTAEVSSEFIAILARAPHQLPQLMMITQVRNENRYLSRFFSIFVDSQERKKTIPAPVDSQNIFYSSMASTKQYIYGFQTIDQLNQTMSSINWVMPEAMFDQLRAKYI